MAKNKLFRFEQNKLAANVVEEGKPLYTQIKGHWNTLQFNRAAPIVAEFGCGNGEYTTGMAEVFPEKNFVGVDIKGARIFKGSRYATDNKLSNVAFLRTRIEFTTDFFAENELSEIWITFPDPQLKDRREKHRLTHPRFLDIYRKFLQPNGIIHLKTDSLELTEYTLEVLKQLNYPVLIQTFDLYNRPDLLTLHKGIQTKYEKMFTAQGKKINYLQFSIH